MKSVMVLTVAVLLLAACQKSADTPAENAAGTTKTATADMADMAKMAPMANMGPMAGMDAMMRSMKAKPMAHDAAMKAMHERHEGMEQIGKSTKAAGRTLKSGSPDLAIVRTAAATIARLAPQTTGWFPAGTGPDVGKTGAKPDIWQKPEDFVARDRAFQKAATAFDAAAKAGDMGAIQARFGEIGKTCKACHDSYRKEMHH